MVTEDRRRATTLGSFLRAARDRARIDRRQFVSGGPRKVPGLRREEVAVLAGVSANYYTRLEQGRERHPSAQVLDALVRALDLDPDEALHLRTLAGAVPTGASPQISIRPALEALLDAWAHTPAIVSSETLDILAQNPLARAMHSGFGEPDNLAFMTFLDPHGRDFYVNWHDAAAATTANLRFALARRPRDARLHQIIDSLTGRSAEFRELWSRNTARGKTFADKRFRHPDVGLLELSYQAFDVRGATGQQLLVYAAAPGSTTSESLRLLATRTGSQRTKSSGTESHGAESHGAESHGAESPGAGTAGTRARSQLSSGCSR